MNKGNRVLIIRTLLVATLIFLLVFLAYNHLYLTNNKILNDRETIKSEVIDSFMSNYNFFKKVAEFATATEGSFSTSGNKSNIKIQNININNTIIEDKEIIEAVQLIFNNTNIVDIGEDNQTIWFYTKDIDGIEHGIVYTKSSIDLGFLEEVNQLKENWYYYWSTNENI